MKKTLSFSLLAVFALLAWNVPALAQTDISTISENIVDSSSRLPSLISALCYILGLVLGIMGIVKLKQHVEDPRSTTLKEPMIRFLVGGAMFALPISYEAMSNTIDAGNKGNFENEFDNIIVSASSMMASIVAVVPLQDFNQILASIIKSVEDVPSLLAGIAYLLGLVLGASGILRLKDHVLNPEQVGLREGVIRVLVAGMLFTLPTVLVALFHTINGDGASVADFLTNALIATGFVFSLESKSAACSPDVLLHLTLDSVVCALFYHSIALPAFFTAFAYLIGLILVIWGILKLKDHVLDPRSTPIWEPVSRLLAGGAFFALPTIVTVAYNSVTGGVILAPHTNTGFNDAGAVGNGLDAMMTGFMTNIFGPLTVLMNWFGYVAGTFLIMIGIMRLMRTAQEGVRGPGGIGTIMTFITGGALLAFSPMITAFSATLFTNPLTYTFATLQYDVGLTPDEIGHIHAVISAILKFVLILGLVSFLRGIFIMRGVAEGKQDSSMMAGVTHLIGGALAVNLGPFLNAVQYTLGLNAYGVLFGFGGP